MAATRVETNVGIARHSIVARAQSVGQFDAQALYEIVRLQGQTEASVTVVRTNHDICSAGGALNLFGFYDAEFCCRFGSMKIDTPTNGCAQERQLSAPLATFLMESVMQIITVICHCAVDKISVTKNPGGFNGIELFDTREAADAYAAELQTKAGGPDNAEIRVHDLRRKAA